MGLRYTRLVVMLVVGAATLTVAACGGGSNQGAGGAPTSTVRPLQAAPAPDPSTPDGAAVAALTAIYTWFPATESPGTSLSRARKYLGPSLIRVLDSPPSGVQAPDPSLQWAQWAQAGARVDAFAFASGESAPPSANPNLRQYKIGIEQTVAYPDGRHEKLTPATVIATVVRTPDGWRLDGFR